MNNDELDAVYTHLCRTLAAHGQAQAPLILARLSLLLITRLDEAASSRELIEVAAQGLPPLGHGAGAPAEPLA